MVMRCHEYGDAVIFYSILCVRSVNVLVAILAAAKKLDLAQGQCGAEQLLCGMASDPHPKPQRQKAENKNVIQVGPNCLE